MTASRRLDNVRSSEHDLTRAIFIFREHVRQKPSIVFFKLMSEVKSPTGKSARLS